jgi:signal transduction histidine kinase
MVSVDSIRLTREATDLTAMRLVMKRLSNWLGRATEEGRAVLNSLRDSTAQSDDLLEALKRLAQEFEARSSINIGFAVTGAVKEMHPILSEEVSRWRQSYRCGDSL